MSPAQRLKVAGATAAFAGVVLAGMFLTSPRGRADDGDDRDDKDPRIERGFDSAPVPLNLEGKNRKMEGLGSYFVNAQMDCDGWKPLLWPEGEGQSGDVFGRRTGFWGVSTTARYWFRAHHLSQFDSGQIRTAGRRQ